MLLKLKMRIFFILDLKRHGAFLKYSDYLKYLGGKPFQGLDYRSLKMVSHKWFPCFHVYTCSKLIYFIDPVQKKNMASSRRC